MIKATGKRDGKEVTVEYTDGGEWLFDGEPNELYQIAIDAGLDECPVIGGTYFPERDSVLNRINVLRERFFDRPVAVEYTDQIEPIPSDPDVVY